MTNSSTLLVVLNTGLFADAQTVNGAVNEISNGHIDRIEIDVSTMNDKDWDDALTRILSAAKVVTL